MPDGYAEKGETRMPSFYFEARERALLGREYDERYRPTGGVHRGLTLNRMRVGDKPGRELWHEAGIAAHPSGFCRESWELDDAEFRPGLHPYYHAGVYYVQEPSASAPAALLDVKPGEYVLDLCAAPGGKSAQLASALQGQGLLVSNEYTPSRTGALKSNLERMGFPNTVLLNESTDRIAAALPGVFDKVLVDAPCSGEGMFRKEPQAEQQHTPALVAQCAALGKQILHDAAQCLKPGGLLCYSTCTFSPEENEVQISAFLDEHPDFSYKGAKACLAFTGYNGILGYRTDETYDPSSDMYDPEKTANPNIEADRAAAREVVEALRADGYELASHSWGHRDMGAITLEHMKKDTDRWDRNVNQELLGGTCDILIYPRGADVGDWRASSYSHSDNAKFDYLWDKGFRYFCNVDGSTPAWVQVGDDFLRQGRRPLDGYNMWREISEGRGKMSDLFDDVSTIFDTSRPTPVPAY